MIPPPSTSPTQPVTITTPITTAAQPPIIISVSISPSGTATAGERYSLDCFVTVTGSTDQPTITWLNLVGSQITSTTGSLSTITFIPLAISHAGTYTCRAMAGGVTEEQRLTVVVNGME